MLLSTAKTDVLNILDDDNTRWSVSEVERALTLALHECVMLYAAQGGTRLDEIASITMTNGSATLSNIPMRITGLAMAVGNARFSLQVIPAGQMLVVTPWSGSLSMRYIRTPTFPASDATHFTYGNAQQDWVPFDRMIVVRAARKLLIKDREVINALEAEANELLSICLLGENQSPVTGMISSSPMNNTPYAAQLVGSTIVLGYAPNNVGF